MSETSDKKRNENRYYYFLIGMGIFITFILWIYPIKKDFFNLLLILNFIFMSVFLQIIVHEVGHLICGLMSGYKFSQIAIINRMFVKVNGEIKCKKIKFQGTIGQCLMIPPEYKNDKYPFVLFYLGGSLADLVTSILFMSMSWFFKDVTYLSIFLMVLTVTGFLFALQNGIPIRNKHINNDGSNVWSLYKSKEARDVMWLQLHIHELITKGKRLKDMPEEWFQLPNSKEMDNAMICTTGAYACIREIDRMKFEKAVEIGNFMLTKAVGLIEIHKNILKLQLIYCEIVGENRKEEIEKLYTDEVKKYIKATSTYISTIRIMYAYYLFVEKNRQKADEQLSLFEKVAKNYPYQSQIISEQELIQYAKQKYENETL